jgi:hypothetical protein
MPVPRSALFPRSAAEFWFRVMLGTWIVLCVLMCVRSYVVVHRNSVYPIFSDAARNWVAGKNLYDEHFLAVGLDQYRYSPIVTVGLVPLSLLPDSVGNVVWRLVNMLIYFGGFAWFCRDVFPGRARIGFGGAALLGLGLLPVSLASLNNGQANPLLIGMMLIGAAAVARERWNLAAVALAVPVLFKIYPIAVALLLVTLYPRRLGWRLGAALAAGLVLPFLFQRPDYVAGQYGEWFTYLAQEDRSHRPLTDSYRDFLLLLRWLDWTPSHRVYQLIQLGTAAGLAALTLWRGRSAAARADVLRGTLDLGCCWIILFGPATENCTYILLGPTLALAGWDAWRAGRPVWTRAALTAIVCIFAGAAIIIALPGGRNVAYLLNPLAALLLFAQRLLSPVRAAPPAADAGRDRDTVPPARAA